MFIIVLSRQFFVRMSEDGSENFEFDPLDFQPVLSSACKCGQQSTHSNLVPRAFPLKNGWGGKSPGDEVVLT